MSDVSRLLDAAQAGDRQAAEQLLPLVYDELRKLAAVKMAQERPGQTLDATALVHEAYLRLILSGCVHGKNSAIDRILQRAVRPLLIAIGAARIPMAITCSSETIRYVWITGQAKELNMSISHGSDDETTSRFFTCHWQNRYWNTDSNPEGAPLRAAGSNRFTERGTRAGKGHVVYVITLSAGQLYLGGRMRVCQIVSREEAVRITGTDRLYPASEWVIDDEGGSPLHLHRRLAPSVTRRLRCIMANGDLRGLFFVDDNNLDVQATRGVRELTEASAELLDQIITLTDAMPNTGKVLIVTPAMLEVASKPVGRA